MNVRLHSYLCFILETIRQAEKSNQLIFEKEYVCQHKMNMTIKKNRRNI
jgi:hypothetical protein